MESDTNVGALRTFGWISFFGGFVLAITLIIALDPHGWLLGAASIVGGIFLSALIMGFAIVIENIRSIRKTIEDSKEDGRQLSSDSKP